jgi:hypothetical protein
MDKGQGIKGLRDASSGEAINAGPYSPSSNHRGFSPLCRSARGNCPYSVGDVSGDTVSAAAGTVTGGFEQEKMENKNNTDST